MKEYIVFEISWDAEDTQKHLDRLAEQGWRLICSYHYGNWLIMERDKPKKCSKCGK